MDSHNVATLPSRRSTDERWQDIAAEDLFRIREPSHGASASEKGRQILDRRVLSDVQLSQ